MICSEYSFGRIVVVSASIGSSWYGLGGRIVVSRGGDIRAILALFPSALF